GGTLGRATSPLVREHEAVGVYANRVPGAALVQGLAQQAVDAFERLPVEVERRLKHRVMLAAPAPSPALNRPLGTVVRALATGASGGGRLRGPSGTGQALSLP